VKVAEYLATVGINVSNKTGKSTRKNAKNAYANLSGTNADSVNVRKNLIAENE